MGSHEFSPQVPMSSTGLALVISRRMPALDVQAERRLHAALRHAAQLLSGSEVRRSSAPRPQYRIQAVTTFREAGPICRTVPFGNPAHVRSYAVPGILGGRVLPRRNLMPVPFSF